MSTALLQNCYEYNHRLLTKLSHVDRCTSQQQQQNAASEKLLVCCTNSTSQKYILKYSSKYKFRSWSLNDIIFITHCTVITEFTVYIIFTCNPPKADILHQCKQALILMQSIFQKSSHRQQSYEGIQLKFQLFYNSLESNKGMVLNYPFLWHQNDCFTLNEGLFQLRVKHQPRLGIESERNWNRISCRWVLG